MGGYAAYMTLGFLLLSLPVMQTGPIAGIDNLFIAVSAVSTTGLVTVDPGTSYRLAGEIVILLLIQVGGLGYMTVSSFLVLSIRQKLSRGRERTVRAAFELPEDMDVKTFLRTVIVFCVGLELAGAAALYPMFTAAGEEEPLWSAIFHAISAFCTAGFSLNANSLEDYRGHVGVNVVVSVLSLAGAIGFLVVADSWRAMTGDDRRLGATSKVILRTTLAIIFVAFLLILFTDEAVRALPPTEQVLSAFFQAMTASTTVGFNTFPIGGLAMSSVVVLMLLMIVGASPAGTGGGLKTTTFAALWALVGATLQRSPTVVSFGRELPQRTVNTASATLVYYCGLLLAAMVLLTNFEPGQPLNVLVFEAMSALGTVGLSLGVTGSLSDAGKAVIIVLMVAGRVGILTFALALALPRRGAAPTAG
ncbi:TrkH family potassium uptake protein [Acuticoccus sp.]|uniref:TrkH family potassium uptake protein n=1 Tax=Acuticoccus sp. TaxID=1904378 RepID=UPI003B528730